MDGINEILPFFDFGYEEYGYIGILIITFFASIILFIPVPYFPVLFTAGINQNLNPHLVALSSAVGAVIAKLIIFYVSYYGRNVILSSKAKKRMLPLQRLLSKYGWPGAFAAALTPIPDDLVYIPLGLAKYNPAKFVIATFTGKFILNEFIVFGSVFLGRPVVEILTAESTDPVYLYIGVGVSISIVILIIFLYLRIDWGKIVGRWFPWTLNDNGDDKDFTDKK
ncbi:MAG TPA: VTT domain-containing protein [Nitrososphaeraceae archaeon]|nr:VTT domain-containing protein [Nitrososphaeraceae archaeon]